MHILWLERACVCGKNWVLAHTHKTIILFSDDVYVGIRNPLCQIWYTSLVGLVWFRSIFSNCGELLPTFTSAPKAGICHLLHRQTHVLHNLATFEYKGTATQQNKKLGVRLEISHIAISRRMPETTLHCIHRLLQVRYMQPYYV